MEPLGPRITGMEHKVNEIRDALERIGNQAGGSQNVATWNVNAGGAGVWIAVTACCVMLALNVVLCLLFLDMSRKYDRMQDHLSAIYMMAPSLKPKD
jgi:hypothetical protein